MAKIVDPGNQITEQFIAASGSFLRGKRRFLENGYIVTKTKLLSKINNIEFSFLLLGPRQSGKSTLIGQLKSEFEVNLIALELFLHPLIIVETEEDREVEGVPVRGLLGGLPYLGY